MSARTAAWLAIGIGCSLAFWLVVWPELLLYSAALGAALGSVSWLCVRRDLPCARALRAADSTWRRYR